MIIQCAVCLLILGEKEPLGDKRVTHTYCPVCYGEAVKEVEEINLNYLKQISEEERM